MESPETAALTLQDPKDRNIEVQRQKITPSRNGVNKA